MSDKNARPAAQSATEAALPGALLVIRMRASGRTYWMVADRQASRTYAPHVSQRAAIERFEGELARRHTGVELHSAQHKPAAAAALLARTFRNA